MISMDDFTDLSKFLLGIPLDDFGISDLPQDLASFYFDIVNGDTGFAALMYAWIPIVGHPASEQEAYFESQIKAAPFLWRQAQNLVMLWYTGVWDPQSSDPALAHPEPNQSYPLALVWTLAQSHPRGVTKSFGYWQYPPSEGQS